MELELVRLKSFEQSRWSCIVLMPDNASWEDCMIAAFGVPKTGALKQLYGDNIYIAGRVAFCQEDAYTLGLKPGDVL